MPNIKLVTVTWLVEESEVDDLNMELNELFNNSGCALHSVDTVFTDAPPELLTEHVVDFFTWDD